MVITSYLHLSKQNCQQIMYTDAVDIVGLLYVSWFYI